MFKYKHKVESKAENQPKRALRSDQHRDRYIAVSTVETGLSKKRDYNSTSQLCFGYLLKIRFWLLGRCQHPLSFKIICLGHILCN